jgi:hypothetical protein
MHGEMAYNFLAPGMSTASSHHMSDESYFHPAPAAAELNSEMK